MKKKLVDLSKVEILVLDEADRMLNMGFIDAVRSIVFKYAAKSKTTDHVLFGNHVIHSQTACRNMDTPGI